MSSESKQINALRNITIKRNNKHIKFSNRGKSDMHMLNLEERNQSRWASEEKIIQNSQS